MNRSSVSYILKIKILLTVFNKEMYIISFAHISHCKFMSLAVSRSISVNLSVPLERARIIIRVMCITNNKKKPRDRYWDSS